MQRLKNITHHLLSNDWATLNRIDYDYQFDDGSWKRISRECYNRGNGTAILLYNMEKSTLILTKQFRMPAYENNQEEGMSIEVCAGALDKNEDPETCIIREVEEETGYKINSASLVLETYMSPGAMTEKLYLFTSEYTDAMKIDTGGGLESENEEIEVMELHISEVLKMIDNKDIIDAKTIMLIQFAQIHKLL
ncbi:NUDIX domain-containing protein [Sediminibacter sp. Hel_I_10]|uniref:NUDIX domain-containing protein n=1 Tax=Sediminibacter sp. Hel_I_10 TaxID=1392490 RepID=UPI00047A5816|nr:NUDIX domain-containing protein [Sediminibacter sp. Hel_I_10]